MFASMCLIHHATVLISTKNFTKWLSFWYTVGLLLVLLTIYLNNGVKGTGLHKSTFTEVMHAPQFYFIVILDVAFVSLCYIGFRSVKEVLIS